MSMRKIILAAVCLAGFASLSPAPVSAHHEAAVNTSYLAFRAAYQAPGTAWVADENCRDGRYWETVFISIFPQGQAIRAAK